MKDGLTAQQLEEAILEEAKGGPTERVDLHVEYFDDSDDVHTFMDRYRKQNPGAMVDYDDHGVYAIVPVEPCPKWVTIYLAVDQLSRSYGGPEEGGWWYDSGDVQERERIRVWLDEKSRAPHVTDGERQVIGQIAERWSQDYEFGTSHRSSMRPRGSDYSWRVTEDVPQDWPRRQPHYE